MEEDENVDYTRKKDIFTSSRSLTHTRRSSQVCSKWRRIILNSPSIWGRVIDLTLFRQKEHYWMDEIIRRTRQSPLHLRGRIATLKKLAYVVDLLDDYWERVSTFDVEVGSYNISQVERLGKIFSRPARSLQSFSITLHPIGDIETGNQHRFAFNQHPELFANVAPILTRFHWDSFNFNLHSHWVPNIHTLEISNMASYSASDLLNTLKRMPNLYTLKIHSLINFLDVDKTQRINLSRLQRLTISGDFWKLGTFLDIILPAPGCSICMDICFFNPVDQTEDMTHTISVINRYCRAYFKHHTSTSLSLEINPTCMRIMDMSSTSPTDSFYSMNIYMRELPTSWDLVDCFNPLLESDLFGHVKHLTASILTSVTCTYSYRVAKYLSSLISLETLMASEETLRVFLPVAEQEKDFLNPNFHTLSLYSGPGGGSVKGAQSTRSSSVLFSFLAWRKELGAPVKTLDFTGCWGYQRDLRALENEYPGMKVQWYVNSEKTSDAFREYVCGSGSPEALRIYSTTPCRIELDGEFFGCYTLGEDDDGDQEG